MYLHLCIYVSMYLCIYASMHLCIYASMHLCIYASMHLCIYASMYLCIYVSMYLCLSVCMPACVYVHLCVCMQIKCACRALASLHPQNHRSNLYAKSNTSPVASKMFFFLSDKVCRAAQIHRVTPSLCRVGPNQASLPWLPWALNTIGAWKAHRAHKARGCSVRCCVTFCKEGCPQRWAFPQQRTQ